MPQTGAGAVGERSPQRFRGCSTIPHAGDLRHQESSEHRECGGKGVRGNWECRCVR